MTASDQIRIIVLEKDENLDTVVRRIEKGWTVRFVRGGSLLGSDVQITTSLTGDTPLTWTSASKGDHLSAVADVKCDRAGAFRYQFTIDGEMAHSGSGYFLVSPQLTCNGRPLSLDGITCQTYLAKLLGPIDEWSSRLLAAPRTGYNMIHLTPIHELGISNSSYSLKDHRKLNPKLGKNGQGLSYDEVAAVVSEFEKEHNTLTVQDVVWNHAAKNADWLREHPECAYNCANSAHLRPAYVLDRVLHHFGREISEGKWEHRGVPAVIDNAHHMHSLEYLLRTEILPRCRMHEFFQCDVEKLAAEFEALIKDRPVEHIYSADPSPLSLEADSEWRRFGRTVDWNKALRIYHQTDDVAACVAALRHRLEELNGEGGRHGWAVCMDGMGAVLGHIRYERVDGHGPRKGRVTEDAPLLTDYFLHTFPVSSLEEEEKLAYDSKTGAYLQAFNGWTMGGDALDNFALPTSEVYLRRQLVCWGDSVKLNYGDKPEDCPYLWDTMKEYTQKCASVFHGLRIDNAHGTPIHVAEYLLRAAREIRPDLYVFAELFTGSEQKDNMFVNRLGITSLIREAQSAHDSHEQGRLVYRYGGDVVGAMIQKSTRLAPQSVSHALFLDQSHDNPSPIHTRSIWDLLPTAGMLAMAGCAAGSTRGYDEMVEHAIHVVSEERLYSRWGETITEASGITKGRKVLNDLHAWLAANGYTQVFVDQMSVDVVAITRHNPRTHETVVAVCHTAFDGSRLERDRVHLKHFPVGGVLEEVLFEMKTVQVKGERTPESSSTLVGTDCFTVQVREHIQPGEAEMLSLNGDWVELTGLASGSVVAIKIRLDPASSASISSAQSIISGESALVGELRAELNKLTMREMNKVLFSCEEEERVCVGDGCYDIPNHGRIVYAGLMGIVPLLDHVRDNNDLGHPICGNIRDGTWLCDYIARRVEKHGMGGLSSVYSRLLAPLVSMPHYLRPCYFEGIVSRMAREARQRVLDMMHPRVSTSGAVMKQLALASVAFMGHVPGAGMAPLPPSIEEELKDCLPTSLSAGLPHFSTGIWRNWGRDTFIALPGCLLSTGRYGEAKATILSYAGSLRHGLIPNLLAEGQGARYNCRDAVWFWLLSIVKYVEHAPDGESILAAPVRRIYPQDTTEFGEEEKEQPLREVIVEAVSRHLRGIEYRERNAGGRIDEHMRNEGFNIKIYVDEETGFVHGGNRWNCGTWMDKMGSSDKAGNRGEPASPRDGAAVELQALAHAVLKEMSVWAGKGLISTDGGERADGSRWTWLAWSEKIAASFEKHFFVEETAEGQYINRRGIVKDSHGSSAGYTDFQLRCNFTIALASSPSLLNPLNAWMALDVAMMALLGPIGIKTLDPTDWAYDGYYNNDDDGDDKKTAKGWNYHQGPEWVWVACFYLRARLAIGNILGGIYWEAAKKEVRSRLGTYIHHLRHSPWRSLPELTQHNGEYCNGSCQAQAWSVGCLMEACIDLHIMTLE